jgi:hypothetical protein
MKKRIVVRNKEATREIAFEEAKNGIKTADDFCLWYLQQGFQVQSQLRRDAQKLGFGGGSNPMVPMQDIGWLQKGRPVYSIDVRDIMRRLTSNSYGSDFGTLFKDMVVLLSHFRNDGGLVKCFDNRILHQCSFTDGNKKQIRPFVTRPQAAKILGVSGKTFERRLYQAPFSYAKRFLEAQINDRVFIYDGGLLCLEALRPFLKDWAK